MQAIINLSETTGSMALTYDGITQAITMTSVPLPYRGRHWYTVCRATGRRVRTLWLAPGAKTFASRHAWPWQTAFASQFLDPVGRAWATKRRIARRLRSTDPHDDDLPSKPPWMRGATYDVSPHAMSR
ncbi:hypothetical protein [Alsobacter sp. R-9]